MASDKKRGGRERTGTVVTTKAGLLQAVITLADGSRKRINPPFPKGTSEAYAKERAKFWQEKADRMKLMPAPKPTKKDADPSTGAAWWAAYMAHREGKGLSPIWHVYRPHILPVLATHPRDWTRADCERLVAVLDAKISSTGEDRISWRTAANAWSLLTSACKAACSAKAPTGLRVRDDNPSAGVEGPDRGEHLLKQWLRPHELVQLVSCATVPLRWRRLYPLLAYTYVRAGELRALQWSDVDFQAGIISITRSWDEKRQRIKPPKTQAGIRSVPIEPNLLPLLRAMHAESNGKGLVVPSMPPMEGLGRKVPKAPAAGGGEPPRALRDDRDAQADHPARPPRDGHHVALPPKGLRTRDPAGRGTREVRHDERVHSHRARVRREGRRALPGAPSIDHQSITHRPSC